jgi:hypothetical protein
VFHGEEALRTDAGAGTVLGPFVFEECQVGGDVKVLREVGGGWLFAAEDRIGAVIILCPEAVEDEAWMRGALGRGALNGAELGRPREIHKVEIEFAGLAFVLGTCGGREGQRGDDEGNECEQELPNAHERVRRVKCLRGHDIAGTVVF